MIINTDFLLNQVYPVGSLYITTNETNPSNFLGGTWEKITSDAYLKIVSSNAGNLDGTSSDHKIPINSMPNHTHNPNLYATTPGGGSSVGTAVTGGTGAVNFWATNTWAGGSQAYYPYYYGIYVFRRTA